MQAGRLRHRIRIDALTIDHDSDDGAIAETWADAFGQMLSAEIMPLSGRELIAAQAVQSKVQARIRIRHRPGVVAAMRAVHRGTVYNIEAVVPDAGSGVDYMTLMCSYGVNDG